MGNLKSINADQFKEKVLDNPGVVVLDFWAEWCGPCHALTPKLEQLQEQFAGQVEIFKCNTDENHQLASQYMITSIPTLLFFKGSEPQGSIIGNVKTDKIADKIEDLI